MHYLRRRYLLIIARLWLIASIIVTTTSNSHAVDLTVWDSIKSANHFVLLRHAIAPGTGDPANFVVDECATQRNLSDAGRRQAKAIGQAFRAQGIDAANVFSSQWCRCLDTANLLSLGAVTPLPALNSFFRHYERKTAQIQALKAWLAQQDLTSPTVLVTHQVTITALTDVYPRSGEMIVVKRADSGDLTVVGQHQIAP